MPDQGNEERSVVHLRLQVAMPLNELVSRKLCLISTNCIMTARPVGYLTMCEITADGGETTCTEARFRPIISPL